MAEIGKYLYCIIPCPQERTFNGIAIGSEAGPVFTVCHNGLAAVVSDAMVKRYESTRQNLMAHEKVLEAVMREFTLLPVRFGTVTDSTSPIRDIQRLLQSRSGEFLKLMGDLADKAELGLRAFWRDEKAVFAELAAENPDIDRLRHSLMGKPAPATHFDRIRLGEMVKEALNRKRAQEAARILSPLRQIALGVRENELLIDRVVLNAAFLVLRSRERELDEAVSRLDGELGERFAFKYTGPAPPYNFVNIVVNWQELR